MSQVSNYLQVIIAYRRYFSRATRARSKGTLLRKMTPRNPCTTLLPGVSVSLLTEIKTVLEVGTLSVRNWMRLGILGKCVPVSGSRKGTSITNSTFSRERRVWRNGVVVLVSTVKRKRILSRAVVVHLYLCHPRDSPLLIYNVK